MELLPNNILFKTSTISNGNMSFRFGKKNEVVENRRKFLDEFGVEFKNHLCMACNHGDVISTVNRTNYGAYLGAKTSNTMLQSEVLVTQEKKLALMLLTADCLPVAFYDPEYKVIALAHLNRKTIAHRLGQKTIKYLTENYHSSPTAVVVKIGPYIHKNSYSFSLPFSEPTPPQLERFITRENDLAYIDMCGAEIAQLEKVGVKLENIIISPIDTATSPEHFSHYQSQRSSHRPQGRMSTILMIKI